MKRLIALLLGLSLVVAACARNEGTTYTEDVQEVCSDSGNFLGTMNALLKDTQENSSQFTISFSRYDPPLNETGWAVHISVQHSALKPKLQNKFKPEFQDRFGIKVENGFIEFSATSENLSDSMCEITNVIKDAFEIGKLNVQEMNGFSDFIHFLSANSERLIVEVATPSLNGDTLDDFNEMWLYNKYSIYVHIPDWDSVGTQFTGLSLDNPTKLFPLLKARLIQHKQNRSY